MAPLYVYGFAPKMTQEEFQNKFFEPFSEDYCEKVDFKGDKIYAFVHTRTLEQANELINYWNGRKMDGGQHPLQVRHKGQNNHGGQNQFNQQSKPMDPVLYVYGFPKGLAEDIFTQEFFQSKQDACKKVDFFGDKLYSFVHCHNNSQCDELIMQWDGKMMNNSKRPLQVRYKGESQNNQWVNMPPVVWVYGFPPKTTQESFCNEFFLQYPGHLKKIDYYEKKLYAFVHCHNSHQAKELITHWDGKMMQNSTQPLQVRFKGQNTRQQNGNMGGNNMGFGQNQYYNNGYGNNGQYFPQGNMKMQNMPAQGHMMQPNQNQFGMQFGMPMQGQQQFQPQHMQQQQQQQGNMGNFQGMPQNGGWGGAMMPQQQFNGGYNSMNKRNGNQGGNHGGNNFNQQQQQQFMPQGGNRQNNGHFQGGQQGQPMIGGGPQHKKGRYVN